MKRILLLAAATAVVCPQALTQPLSGEQLPPPPEVKPIRIPVRHADPWLIKALLEGQFVTMPEISTLMMGPEVGNAVSSLLQGWRIVVNPTDNSLWLFPDRR
jgi:hypothetical protein